MDNKSNSKKDSRRNFIKNASLATAGFYIVPRHVLGRGYVAPSDKLVIAGIGAGGKGESDIQNFYESGKAEIAALCDVDDRQAVKTRAAFPRQNIIRISAKCLIRKEKALMHAPFQFQTITMLWLPWLPCS
jgi:hypothetical protein